jgi:alkylation response protein AidB-like acyl-CoA dehydrogenase
MAKVLRETDGSLAARLKDAQLEFCIKAATCKYFVLHLAERVACLAVEAFGGSGFVRGYS